LVKERTMMRNSFLLLLLSVVPKTLLFSQSLSYTITDLGPGTANGINDLGQVVGTATLPSGAQHAFVWTSGVIVDIGTLPQFLQSSAATGINVLGQVVGNSSASDGSQHAFSWTAGSGMTDLGTLGGAFSAATALNSAGTVVGGSNLAGISSYPGHAFIWTSGTGMRDLGTLGAPNGATPNSYASSINDAGQIAGDTSTSTSSTVACVFHDGIITDLRAAYGLVGMTGSWATGINQQGHFSANDTVPFSWASFLHNGVLTRLKFEYYLSSANGINSSDQLVGTAPRLGIYFAWVYTRGTVIDLNTVIPAGSGWQLTSATAVNSSGQIVGYGTLNGVQHAFLLTTTSQPTGTMSVTTNLAAASFGIRGSGTFSGTGQFFGATNVAAGIYTIAYASVPGYATPSSQTLTLAPAGSLSFNGTYTALTQPPAAATLGNSGTTTNTTVSVAEPVNTATGNYYASYTDLSVPGKGLSFVFTRNYNSQDSSTAVSALGAKWTHSYNVSLTVAGDGSSAIRHGDGHQELFSRSANGSYTAATTGLFSTLVKNADGTFTLTRKNQTRYTFSASGSLASVSDRNGNTQTLNYDNAGRLSSIMDTGGRSFAFSYDGNNRMIGLSDPLSRTLRYGYDASGNLTSFQDAAGGVTSYVYDSSHRVVSATDPRGNVYLRNTYDAQGRVTLQTNARGFATAFAYDTPAPLTTSVTDPTGKTTQYVYDAGLRLSAMVDSIGGQTSYTYDGSNLQASVTDAFGNRTAFTYDPVGNLTGKIDTNVRTYLFDSQNNLTSVTDPLGRQTTFTWSSNGNLLTTRDAAGGVTSNTYDSSGLLLSTTDTRGLVTTFRNDAFGDRTRVTDGAGGVTQITHDAVGRLLTTRNPLGKTWTRTYDADDRLLSSSDPLGNRTSYAYDANGNRTQVTDANGTVTAYAYDSNNNLVQVRDAAGGITAYAYNGNDDRTGVTDANGHTSATAYDPLRRLQSRTDPLGRIQTYTYDAAGNITKSVDGNTRTNTFTYDTLNRRTGAALLDGKTVSYSYDATGNRTAMTDWRGQTVYTYDVLNRVTSVVQPDGNTVRYGYDAAGNRASIRYPDGKDVTYSYDAVNRLTGTTDWASRTTASQYDGAGNLTATLLPNGATTAYAYDDAGRLASVINRSRGQANSSYTYVLDRVGNRIEVASGNEGVQRYGYDKLNRLTSWTSPSRQQARYSYDPVGNRLSLVQSGGPISYTYDAADELLTAGGTIFSYDGNGNQLSKASGGTTVAYGWDALNRLTSVAGGGISTQYRYDGDGNRVSQQAGTGTYAYLNDTATALPVTLNENGPDGNISYAYGTSLISGSAAGFESFYQFDGLGSVATVTDQAATQKANYQYDPWGKTAPFPDFLGQKNKFRFTGEAVDDSTGLLFLRARYYDPAFGRFISRDSNPAPQDGDHAYQYALSNPVRFTDPSGFGVFTFFGNLFGFANWADSARQQRTDALNCVLNDPNCDVDAAQKTYYGVEREAYRKAGEVAIEGADFAYGGTALSGGLGTDFEPGTVLGYAKKAYDYFDKARDVVGGILALTGSDAGRSNASPSGRLPNGPAKKGAPRK
jgi:RHS repeat-associated protein